MTDMLDLAEIALKIIDKSMTKPRSRKDFSKQKKNLILKNQNGKCNDCKKIICSYCIEDCSGCHTETCEKCYKAHQVKCKECDKSLCKTELIKELCPICDMNNG